MNKSKLYFIIAAFVSSFLITSISAQESRKNNDSEKLQLSINERYDETKKGVRVKLSYNHNYSTFYGSVENTTSEYIEFVSVRIILSNGASLGPNSLKALEPNSKMKIKFKDDGQMFNWWLPNVTLTDKTKKYYSDVDPKSGKIYGLRAKKEVGIQDSSKLKSQPNGEQLTTDLHNTDRSTQDIHSHETSSEDIHSTLDTSKTVKSTKGIK